MQQPNPRAQSNGVLQVSAARISGKPAPKQAAGPRLKVIIRRLAPGLTEEEFWKYLGTEWTVGQGRVDWASYKNGKDSKDLSKPSRPSRAYLHLTSETQLLLLSEQVRKTQFEDALNTWNSSALLGPPTVEFAPFPKVPLGKRRTDARQGTIDQDPEFMDFLESLANPSSVKESPPDADPEAPTKGEKVTITPLVQYLKDKKANKGKEAAATKAAKAAKEAAAAKTIAKPSKDSNTSVDDSKKVGRESRKDKAADKAPRESVKVLSRDAAAKSATATSTEPAKTPRSVARERGSIAAAARILQRDLGLSPGNAHRRAKADAENAAKNAAEGSSTAATAPATATPPPKAPQGPSGRHRASRDQTDTNKPSSPQKAVPAPSPMTLLKKPAETATPSPPPATQQATPPTIPTAPSSMADKPPTSAPLPSPTPAGPARQQPPLPVPSPGATRAFVKHANPSQGVTEALLKEAMETFGPVSHVEIDKRKGFAYVDFVKPEGLKKAMANNPTKIAQGTVQVLERKDARPAGHGPPVGPMRGGFPGRGGRGGPVRGRGGRGGGGRGGGDVGAAPASAAAASPAPPPSAPAGPAAAVK